MTSFCDIINYVINTQRHAKNSKTADVMDDVISPTRNPGFHTFSPSVLEYVLGGLEFFSAFLRELWHQIFTQSMTSQNVEEIKKILYIVTSLFDVILWRKIREKYLEKWKIMTSFCDVINDVINTQSNAKHSKTADVMETSFSPPEKPRVSNNFPLVCWK